MSYGILKLLLKEGFLSVLKTYELSHENLLMY